MGWLLGKSDGSEKTRSTSMGGQGNRRKRTPRRHLNLRTIRLESLEERRLLSLGGLEMHEAALGWSSGLPPVAGQITQAQVDRAFASLTTTGSTAPAYLTTAQSTGQINLDDFEADPLFDGIDGSGFATVILDTGIDLDHSLFGPDADENGIADRIVYQQDFADGDMDATDVDGHGSNVSSIAAVVAPGADIIHLKVFTNAGTTQFSYIESALQWVVANAATYDIASVNMSLGDGLNHSTAQALYGISDELAALVNLDVMVVSASGNSFFPFGSAQGVAYPSADPNSLSVGAVYDANSGGWSYDVDDDDYYETIAYTTDVDRIAPFSQRHSNLTTIMAPGAVITGANATGGTNNLHGTSQAAPHIAGLAVLAQDLAVQELGRRLTQAEFVNLLQTTGVTVNDGDDENDNVTNTGLDFTRVDVDALGKAILALDGIGVFRADGDSGRFILDSNFSGEWEGASDRTFLFGYDDDVPIVGDWDGDGDDEIGVHRNVGGAGYFIQDYNDNGYWDGGDRYFVFGDATDTPIIGDWDGDGDDDIGSHRAVGDAGYFIQDYNGNGYWDGGDRFFVFGYDDDTPIIGDWDGDGDDEIGVHRVAGAAGQFIQDYNGNGYWDGGDRYFTFGDATDTPIIGDWDGDGDDEIGSHRAVGAAGYFIQDLNANGYWDVDDRYFIYGGGTDTPIIGDWSSPESALMAAEGEVPLQPDTPALQPSDLEPVLAEALASWEAFGLPPEMVDLLASVEFVITDLPGATLGLATHSTIYLDQYAAGHGWFVDLTPGANEEFAARPLGHDLLAISPQAVDRIDLLTVVTHELGHILGLEDLFSAAGGLMSHELNSGVRRLAGQAERDALFDRGYIISEDDLSSSADSSWSRKTNSGISRLAELDTIFATEDV